MPFAVLFQDEPKSVALLLSIGVFVWAAIHGERMNQETARSWHAWHLAGAETGGAETIKRRGGTVFGFRRVIMTINGL